MRNRIMLTLRVKQITCISFRKKLIWRKLIIQYKRNLSRKFKWKRRKKPCWLLRCKSRKMRRKSRDNNKKRRSRTRFQMSYLIITLPIKLIIFKSNLTQAQMVLVMMMIRPVEKVLMHSETSQIHVMKTESKQVLMPSNKTILKMNNINNT